MNVNTVYQGSALSVLKTFPDQSVQCCVTSPPYYGLRDYGIDEQLGNEETPEEYIEKTVEIFMEVHRVLKDSGTLWLNLGDSYGGNMSQASEGGRAGYGNPRERMVDRTGGNIKEKDLIGIPWEVALALRNKGWYLRSDIIWSKPNPMPESVKDRPTKAHEYIFLLSKKKKYYYDYKATSQEMKEVSIARAGRGLSEDNKWNKGAPGSTAHSLSKPRLNKKHRKMLDPTMAGGESGLIGHSGYYDREGNIIGDGTVNKRTVWEVATKSFNEAHFATYPQELIIDCIKAGTKKGDIVLDPFGGSGTTGIVARKLERNYVMIELNPEYIDICNNRIYKELGMFK